MRDYQMVPTSTLLAQTKHENYEIVASVNVNIQVKDLNDNKPVFESDLKEAVVETLPAALMIQVKATDHDSGDHPHVAIGLDSQTTRRRSLSCLLLIVNWMGNHLKEARP
ncbi:protocadherin Fat 1-like protein [Lates japonicus]|uniref:Protocadherin Fat 1-like protein n=1 Tax=Lates japonicus TaxID=270547 RepID=A0AAD3QZZ9_LATJO|nr:protocadherin Fat 1-like protein [Lates japonicus]